MKFIIACLLMLVSYCAFTQNVTIYKSPHDFERTATRLDSLIKSKKLTYHQVYNYDKKIRRRQIQHNRVFVFEDKKMTEEMLQCDPLVSLDMPLRILIWDEEGEVYLGYIDPVFMKRRFQLKDCNEKLDELTRLLVRLTNECIKVGS